MARVKLSIDKFQDRLADNFSKNGIVGGALVELTDQEDAAGQTLSQKYIGHRYLSDCSQAFAYETLEKTIPVNIGTIKTKIAELPVIFVEFLMIFRRIRAAHISSINGYPAAGYVLLRDVKDRCIFLSAVFQEHVTYTELMGITKDEPKHLNARELHEYRRKKRMQLERKLIDNFITSADFNEDTHFELKRWQDLFNWETHGSHLSQANTITAWVNGEGSPQVVEVDNLPIASMFMNRFNEATWLYHRLLPNLQAGTDGFGKAWNAKWRILDDSFWQMELGLAEIGKKIGEAFVVFIDKKFPFDERTRLPLAGD